MQEEKAARAVRERSFVERRVASLAMKVAPALGRGRSSVERCWTLKR